MQQKRRRKTSKEERVCPICSASFNKAEHLLRHSRSHSKEKPFGCRVCGRKYSRQDTLLRHSRVHDTNRQQAPSETSQARSVISVRAADHTGQGLGDAALDQSPSGLLVTPSPSHGTSFAASVMAAQQQLRTPRGDNDLSFLDGTPASFGEGSSSLRTKDMSESSPGTRVTDGSTNFTIPSTGEGNGIRQCDLLPYWDLQGNTQGTCLNGFATSNAMDFNNLNLSALICNDATEDYPLQLSMTGNHVFEDDALGDSGGQGPDSTSYSITLGSNQSETIIQKCWHTYTGHTPSGLATPDTIEEDGRADADRHRDLANRLQPRIQHGVLPSTSFLDLCVSTFFAHFNPIFPVLHEPSFRPHSQNGLLLLSICSAGSLFIGSPKALSHGISMFERLNKAILSSWDSLAAGPETQSHVALQACTIAQLFGLLVGRPRDLLQIEFFHGSVVMWARTLRLFRLLNHDHVQISELKGQSLEQAWKKWIHQEERIRIVLALLLFDAELAAMFNHERLIQMQLNQIPRASSNEAFTASSAANWQSIMLKEAQERQHNGMHLRDDMVSQTSQGSFKETHFPEMNDGFQLCVLLRRIGTMANSVRASHNDKYEKDYECKGLLVSWLDKYRDTTLFQQQEPSLLMLWHSIFACLYADMDMLEVASGREGVDEQKLVEGDAQIWACSPEARQCVVHCILVQKHFGRMPLSQVVPIHAMGALYRCGVVWYCYMRFGAGQAHSTGLGEEMELMSELRSLRNGMERSILEDTFMKTGKALETSFIVRTVDLLQRISHWKVAERLSSTLLALVDESHGLT